MCTSAYKEVRSKLAEESSRLGDEANSKLVRFRVVSSSSQLTRRVTKRFSSRSHEGGSAAAGNRFEPVDGQLGASKGCSGWELSFVKRIENRRKSQSTSHGGF